VEYELWIVDILIRYYI